MIETRDLWVRFGPVAAVRELSLRAESGGWTALIGPNGAGKTSALRAPSHDSSPSSRRSPRLRRR